MNETSARNIWLRRFTPIAIAVIATYPIGVLLSFYLLGYVESVKLGAWPQAYQVPLPGAGLARWHFLSVRYGLVSFPIVTFCCLW